MYFRFKERIYFNNKIEKLEKFLEGCFFYFIMTINILGIFDENQGNIFSMIHTFVIGLIYGLLYVLIYQKINIRELSNL